MLTRSYFRFSFVALLSLLLLSSCAGQAPLPRLEPLVRQVAKVPVVLVPGITGTALRDRESGELAWGIGGRLFSPRDDGYSLARPIDAPLGSETRLAADAVIEEMRLFGYVKPIYGPIPEMLEQHGYVRGDLDSPSANESLFLFGYDWRGDNVTAAAQLRERLEALADARDEQALEVDLICQSNGANICRYLLKYGGGSLDAAEAGTARAHPRLRIRKLIMAGTANGGSLRILREVHRGRRYVPLVGRWMRPEVLFTFPAVYQDLPVRSQELFVGPEGEPLGLDLLDSATWQQQGWSAFDEQARERMARRPDLFGDEAGRLAFVQRSLDRAQRLHDLLARDVPTFGDTRYYSIQNPYYPTPRRAAVLPRGKRRLLFTGDPELEERSYLRALLSAPGDGHATVESQQALSPQERAAMAAPPFLVEGKHFELILDPGSLRRLLDFLAEP